MKAEILKYLEDIKLSIEIIENHIGISEDIEDYENNLMKSDAVERRLAIIGEALYKADKIDKTIIITEKSKIIKLRHILVHEYDLIEDATIWNIIHKNLPVLKLEVESLLQKL